MIDDEFPPRLLIELSHGRVVLSTAKQPPVAAGPPCLRLIAESRGSTRGSSQYSSIPGSGMIKQWDQNYLSVDVLGSRRTRFDFYRCKAISCENAAKVAMSDGVGELFRKLANQWRALADQIEFLNKLDQAEVQGLTGV